MDGARRDVMVQLLTYGPVSDGEYYDVLEGALRRAAARGVHVRLLVSDWCKRESTLPYLKSLCLVPNIDVRLVTIPEWSGGFIPYARVIHAKYLVVDGERAWIGTSNWERGYFHESRNLGVVVESPRAGAVLARFFETGWDSPYAYPLRPEMEYPPPRIGK
jgi:phosphatidylserine/phosphatidylglycerophosphate/cardiolipin synthase-like enzyme